MIQWARHKYSQTDWVSSSHTASRPRCSGLFHFRGRPSLFFIGKGFGCYQVVAAQYQTRVWLVNRQLALLQTPHSAEPSRVHSDTDPTPITSRQPALIDPSNTFTSIYILFHTCQGCCGNTCLRAFTVLLWGVYVCLCISCLLCVSLDEASSLLLVVDMDPFSP